jgi:FkbM family methyltransferase
MNIKTLLSRFLILLLNPHRLELIRWMFLCYKDPGKVTEFTLTDGSKFVYPLKSAIGLELSCHNFEELEFSFILDFLREGDVFFDVGANGGFFTVAAAKKIGPSGHVYAFEPSLRERALLERNIEINNLDNVTILPFAVGDKNENIKFVLAEDGALNSIKETNHPSQKPESEIEVRMVTLDWFVKENNIPKINFIKIDVEGAEKLAFEGSQEILSNINPMILFEANQFTSTAFGYSKQDLFDCLHKHDYAISTWIKNGTLTPIVNLENKDITKKYNNFLAVKPNTVSNN